MVKGQFLDTGAGQYFDTRGQGYDTKGKLADKKGLCYYTKGKGKENPGFGAD